MVLLRIPGLPGSILLRVLPSDTRWEGDSTIIIILGNLRLPCRTLWLLLGAERIRLVLLSISPGQQRSNVLRLHLLVHLGDRGLFRGERIGTSTKLASLLLTSRVRLRGLPNSFVRALVALQLRDVLVGLLELLLSLSHLALYHVLT